MRFAQARRSNQERTSNDQRDVHPPQLVVIEFDGKDVVCESTGGSGFDAVIKPPTDIEIEIPMG